MELTIIISLCAQALSVVPQRGLKPEEAFGNGYFPLAKYYPSNVHLY